MSSAKLNDNHKVILELKFYYSASQHYHDSSINHIIKLHF